MNNPIATFQLESLSSALESEWWNKDEFVVFSGHLPPPALLTPFRQDYFSLFIPDAGLMELEVDVVKYKAGKNDLLCINPWHVVHISSISVEMNGKVIAFKKEFLDGDLFNPIDKLNFINSTPLVSLKEAEAVMVRGMMDEMLEKLADHTRPNRRHIAVNLISVLLYEIDAIFQLSRGKGKKRLSTKEIINSQFHELVATSFLKERSVKYYAKELNISPRYLNELTKEITGKKASDLIEEMVMREARIFLKNTNLSVKQIADELNFSDQFTFSKYFKKSAKVSPSEYRDLD